MSVFQYLKSPHLAYGICVQSKNHRIMKAYLPTIWYDMLAYPRPSHSPPKPSTVQLPVITASLLLLKKVLNFELFSFLFLEVTFSKRSLKANNEITKKSLCELSKQKLWDQAVQQRLKQTSLRDFFHLLWVVLIWIYCCPKIHSAETSINGNDP